MSNTTTSLLKLVFLTLVFSLYSCNGDDDSGSGDDMNSQFSATIAGEAFVVNPPQASALLAQNGTLTIFATDTATNQVITLTIPNGSEGMFSLSNFSDFNTDAVASYAINGQVNSSYLSTWSDLGAEGLINITELDLANLIVTGTFNFIGIRTIDENLNVVNEPIQITNGVFNTIPLVIQ